MQIREHAGTGKPAVILHPSGTVVTFDEMEARANRLAHYFRKAGLVEGDAVAILMENNEHIHAVMWAARRSRAVLRADQHPPDRGRGGLHRRQQQRQGDHRVGGAAQDAVRTSAEHLPSGLPQRADDRRRAISTAGSATPNALPTNPIPRSTTRSKATCCSTRRAPPAGPRASNANCRTCRRPRRPGMMSALVGFWMDPDAVYLSPAPLYHTAPSVWSMTMQARRHHDGGDGEVRRRGLPRRHRSATASPTASSSRRCSPGC